jgi:ABC-type uncharacterized transport system permease subunit
MTTNKSKTKIPLNQKLLKQNYKWWYTYTFYLKSYGSGIIPFFVGQLSDIIQALALVYIWVLANANPTVISYLVIGRIFKSLSDCFVAEEISPLIMSGKISNYLIFPSNFTSIIFFKEISRRTIFNIARAFALLVTILFFYKQMDFGFLNLYTLILFLPLLIISYISSFYIEFIAGFAISFFDDKRNYNGLKKTFNGLTTVLSGAIIPLDKLPFYNEIIQFLPTTFWLHHPIKIFQGQYNLIQTIFVFLGGIIYCLILYAITNIIFKMGLKRNEAVGL